MRQSHYQFLFNSTVNHPYAEGELSDEQLECVVGGIPFQGTFPMNGKQHLISGRPFVMEIQAFVNSHAECRWSH